MRDLIVGDAGEYLIRQKGLQRLQVAALLQEVARGRPACGQIATTMHPPIRHRCKVMFNNVFSDPFPVGKARPHLFLVHFILRQSWFVPLYIAHGADARTSERTEIWWEWRDQRPVYRERSQRDDIASEIASRCLG